MPQINMPAQDLIALLRDKGTANQYLNTLFISAVDSEGALITAQAKVNNNHIDHIDDVELFIVECDYSGDDQVSAIDTNKKLIKTYINHCVL